jgi:Domain of unknown function (DUF4116)
MDISIAKAFLRNESIGFNEDTHCFQIIDRTNAAALKALSPDLAGGVINHETFLDELAAGCMTQDSSWMKESQKIVDKLASIENPKTLETIEKIKHAQNLFKIANPLLDESIPDFLRSDSKYVLNSVRINGLTLRFASRDIKDSRRIVREAIEQDGLAYRYASARLKDDDRICHDAAKKNGQIMLFANIEQKKRQGYCSCSCN